MEAIRLVRRAKLRFVAGFDLLFPILYGLGWAVLGIVLQLRFFPIGDIDLETDFYGDLVIAARHLIEGHFSVYDFPYKGPLYAFLLVLMRGIDGDWYHGAIVLSAISGGAYLVLAYRLVLRLFDRRVAILTMITASLVVEFFVQGHRASTDVLFLLLSLGSMTCTLLAGGSSRQLAVAGGLAALAFLTRYNGIFLVGGAALVLGVVNPDGLERRQRVKLLCLYLGVFLLVSAPWFIANWMEAGQILASRNLENIVSTFYGSPRWFDDPAAKIRSLPALVAVHPGYFISQFARNLIEHPKKDLTLLLGWPMALIPLAGILGFVIRPPTRRQIGLYLFAVAYWLFMGIVFYAPRYSLPMVLPYMAAGFSLIQGGSMTTAGLGWRVRRWLQTRGHGPAALAVLLVLPLALVVIQIGRVITVERMIHERRPLYILKAAQALAQHEPRSRARILARKGHIAYYAGFDFVPYSMHIGPEELLRFTRSQRVEYIVYSKIEYSMLPHLLFLAVTDTVPLLQEVYRAPGTRIFHLPEGTGTSFSDRELHNLLLASLRAARAQGRPAALCIACEDLGLHYLQKQKFTAAAQSFQDALEVAQRADDGPGMERATADARHNLAITQLSLGRPETAIPLLQKNLEYFAAHGSKNDIAQTHATLGRAYAIMSRDEEAREERRMARELYLEIGYAVDSDSLWAGPLRSEEGF